MKHSKSKLPFILFLAIIFMTSCSNLDIQKLNQRAVQLMEAGNVDGAIARLESINDLSPNFPQTHYNLGVAYHKKGYYLKAAAAFSKAISLNNAFTDAYYSLGVVFEEMAVQEIDKLKNKKNDTETASAIVDYIRRSIASYEDYLRIAKNPSDAEDVKSKIEFLKNDLIKYETMLIDNKNTVEDQSN